MHTKLSFLAAVCLVSGVSLATAQAATNFFLLAEWPGRVVLNDSFVVALTNSEHIAHARDLIHYGPEAAGEPILVAYAVGGEDGVNRDLRRNGVPWCWHVTSVLGFADSTAEILDGGPSGAGTNYPCGPHPVDPTGGGMIGFWGYTVVAELPLRPRFTAIEPRAGGISVSVADLTPPFAVSIETATNLASATWQVATNFRPDRMTATVGLPLGSGSAFFRARVP